MKPEVSPRYGVQRLPSGKPIAGVPTPDALKRQYHGMRDLVARYSSLREDHLRYLVKCGLLRPVALFPDPGRSNSARSDSALRTSA